MTPTLTLTHCCLTGNGCFIVPISVSQHLFEASSSMKNGEREVRLTCLASLYITCAGVCLNLLKIAAESVYPCAFVSDAFAHVHTVYAYIRQINILCISCFLRDHNKEQYWNESKQRY